MKHPIKAAGGWKLKRIVFDTGPAMIAVAILEKKSELVLVMRWNEGQDLTKAGKITCRSESPHGNSTDWMILPLDFPSIIWKVLLEKKAVGAREFNRAGYHLLKKWLVEKEVVFDGFCF